MTNITLQPNWGLTCFAIVFNIVSGAEFDNKIIFASKIWDLSLHTNSNPRIEFASEMNINLNPYTGLWNWIWITNRSSICSRVWSELESKIVQGSKSRKGPVHHYENGLKCTFVRLLSMWMWIWIRRYAIVECDCEHEYTYKYEFEIEPEYSSMGNKDVRICELRNGTTPVLSQDCGTSCH